MSGPDVPRVVVADPNLLAVRAELEAALPAGTTVDWQWPYDVDALRALLPGAQVLVTSWFSAALTDAAADLRLLQSPSAGVEGIDTSALPPGVRLANTFHHEDSIAEHVLAATVVLRRGLLRLDAALRTGHWASSTYTPATPVGASLAGARVGLVGFGHIGRATWRLFRAAGATGVAVTGSGRPDAGAGLAWTAPAASGLPRLLAESDVIVLSAPLTPATRGMIGAVELSQVRPGAVLVNVGRGPLVDEDALYDALVTGRLGGAALDVWWQYPQGSHGRPSARPFGELDTVLLTPHVSGITRQTLLARAGDVAENVRRLGTGEPLLHPVPRQD